MGWSVVILIVACVLGNLRMVHFASIGLIKVIRTSTLKIVKLLSCLILTGYELIHK